MVRWSAMLELTSWKRRLGSCRHNVMPQIFRCHPFLWELPLELVENALVAGGLPVHFLQKLAHCIELRAETFPIPGLQSFHCLIIAIKRLPCLTCRRASEGHLLCGA